MYNLLTILKAILHFIRGVSDYVVEQSTSGMWTYEKWASGRVMCSATLSFATESDKYTTHTVALPLTFANTNYVVTATPSQNGSIVTYFGDYNYGGNRTHTTTSFAFTYSVSSVYSTSFNFIVIGRWK